jgi:gamma-glutamyltranspeptidase/glutathione hydrolase
MLSKTYGKLPWKSLFEPAIRHAEEGFPISALTAEHIAAELPDFPAPARPIYDRKAGERLVQKDLAGSLKLVAQRGAQAIHGGALGAAIERQVRAAGGFLTMADLRENRAEWRDTVSIDYRGRRLIAPGPPTNSWNGLLRLGILGRFDVASLGAASAEYLHLYAEVTKLAYRIRLENASDPDIAPPPLDRLLSEHFWEEAARSIDRRRARPFSISGAAAPSDHFTTHFVVADQAGNMVSATQTLGSRFGSKVFVPGAGIWLNNSLFFCTFEPKGNPMDAFPGHRKLAGFCPMMVERDGRPVIAIGTPGGHTILQTVPQMIVNLLDFGMDIGPAIAAPRISFVEPRELSVEESVPAALREALTARGHDVKPTRRIGNAHGLVAVYDSTGRVAALHGAADPRGEGIGITI